MILSKEEFEEFEQDFNDTSVLTDILKEELAGFSLFNALVCVAAGFKQSISLIIDANGKFAAFCPHFMEEASLPTAELTQVLTGSHTGFSINELIDISGATPPEITALSSNESRLLELIRSDRKISDIAIRMNKDGKMSLLKFTRKQVLKDMSEFERLVKKSEYCDIQFSTAQGKVLSCVKTTKIKFN